MAVWIKMADGLIFELQFLKIIFACFLNYEIYMKMLYKCFLKPYNKVM